MKPHSAGLWLLVFWIMTPIAGSSVRLTSPAAQRASQSWTSAGGESCIHLTSICWLWNMELSSPVHLWGTGWPAVQVARSLRLSHPEWAGPCCSKGRRLDQVEKEGSSSKVPFITWELGRDPCPNSGLTTKGRPQQDLEVNKRQRLGRWLKAWNVKARRLRQRAACTLTLRATVRASSQPRLSLCDGN